MNSQQDMKKKCLFIPEINTMKIKMKKIFVGLVNCQIFKSNNFRIGWIRHLHSQCLQRIVISSVGQFGNAMKKTTTTKNFAKMHSLFFNN